MAVIKVKVWWRELHRHDLCSVQFPSANWRTKDQREEYFQTMEEEQKNVPLLKTLRPTPTPEKTKRQRQQNGNPSLFWILYLHTRVEPVGRVAKMNWLNYDMGMKIHAICDAKNAILKYFSLDMWKFAQIWAFFFLYGEF